MKDQTLATVITELRKLRRKQSTAKAQRVYHDKRFRVVSTKVKKEDSDRFIELCAAENLTRHEALKIYIERANDQNTVFFWE